MSLETVVTDIREEARERASEIDAETEARVEEIVDAAEEEAAEIRAESEREAESRVDQEREQKLSSAKLEAKQKRLEARRDVLDEVRTAVENSLADLEADEREELIRELLDAASTEFETGESVRVYARSDDEALVTDVLADYDGYEFAGEYDCLGGVVVESDESRVRVNNTFDSILEQVWDDHLKEISTRLFDTEAQ